MCCTSSPAASAPPWAIPARTTSSDFRDNAVFVKISGAALSESHVHDVSITRESPNYRGGN